MFVAAIKENMGPNWISGEDMILDVLGEGVNSNSIAPAPTCAPVVFPPGEGDRVGTPDEIVRVGVDGLVVVAAVAACSSDVVETRPTSPNNIEWRFFLPGTTHSEGNPVKESWRP